MKWKWKKYTRRNFKHKGKRSEFSEIHYRLMAADVGQWIWVGCYETKDEIKRVRRSLRPGQRSKFRTYLSKNNFRLETLPDIGKMTLYARKVAKSSEGDDF